jgi:hypothetical protein
MDATVVATTVSMALSMSESRESKRSAESGELSRNVNDITMLSILECKIVKQSFKNYIFTNIKINYLCFRPLILIDDLSRHLPLLKLFHAQSFWVLRRKTGQKDSTVAQERG